MSPKPSSSHPISGVTVVDLTQVIAGPFATMMLADMGADIVKMRRREGEISRERGSRDSSTSTR